MRNTTLGAHGPEVGVIGLGAMGMSFAYDMGAPRDEATSISVIHQALDLGMTLIDTADVYGPYTNEELLGRALAGQRDRAVIATKVGREIIDPIGGPGGSPLVKSNGRPEHVRASIDGSLRRLGTDHVELYQLHRVDAEVPIEETWGAMAEAVAAGKVRYLGLSEVTVEQIQRAQAVHPVTAVQSEFSLWSRDVQAEVLPYCERNGIGFLPYSPLGRGFLVGRFASFDELPENDQRRRLPRFQQDNLRANLDIAAKVREVAERIGATPAQVALAWLIAQGSYIVPIPGTKTPRYLADNAGAADLRLSAADLADLDSIPAPVGARY
ncbi:aldo/keto reductase [Rugosimonospora africana]|uniref:Aldo/keto reductase n=1 Tax=Rugosimonospora africana TaxID=556532 RepID=A0A8J3VTD2_9ACTN|nr:aldo/keto reductase [Rugosimonospora africana]GIH18312.1 aldo/keto reductase [Rugosimonospora africana]